MLWTYVSPVSPISILGGLGANMEDANYSQLSKFHLEQIVTRKLGKELVKEQAQITEIRFLIGGTITYILSWDDGSGGSAFEPELVAVDELLLPHTV